MTATKTRPRNRSVNAIPETRKIESNVRLHLKCAPPADEPRPPGKVLQILTSLREDASDLELPSPSIDLVDEACRVASTLFSYRTGKYLLYMMPDESVTIDLRGSRPNGILVFIDPDKKVHCSGENRGEGWRLSCDNSRDFPNVEFLQKLDALEM